MDPSSCGWPVIPLVPFRGLRHSERSVDTAAPRSGPASKRNLKGEVSTDYCAFEGALASSMLVFRFAELKVRVWKPIKGPGIYDLELLGVLGMLAEVVRKAAL